MPNLKFERELKKEHVGPIAGVDEAGRGPLAGPVVAGAVILPEKFRHNVLTDSKKLSASTRERLFEELTTEADIRWSWGECSSEEVDSLNILRATHLAMKRAILGLKPPCSAALVDGLPVQGLPVPHRAIVKGDSASLSIAAASIIAKVTRDRMMIEFAVKFPEYGFEKHKGYGTKAHLAALEKDGPCAIHRMSFRPVAQSVFSFKD